MSREEKSITYKARKILCVHKEAEAQQGYISVCKGNIKALGAEESKRTGARIVDFGDLIIAPLFCDYHLHFSGQVDADAASIGTALIHHGIGTAYDGGDKGSTGLTVKKILKGLPHIMSAGYAIFRKGGYGAAIGQAVESVDAAVTKINELQSLSVDYIKIIHSGIFDPESGQITPGGFDPNELFRIVEYARTKGLDVFCHANGARAVLEAVDAGVSAVIHGLSVSDATLSVMAEKKVAFIPTLRAFESLHSIVRTELGRANLERALLGHLAAVRTAHELGVRVLPGSDAGPRFLPYGSSYLAELSLFEKAGLAYPDIIRAASMTVLRRGAPANFVVLDGLTVRQVVINGSVVF